MAGKWKKKSSVPVGTLALFLVAVALLLCGSVGSAQAALTYFSETYTTRMETHNIGVTLLENGNKIAWRDYQKERAEGIWNETQNPVETRLLQHLVPEGENFLMGKGYGEELAVENTGTIDEYVRVNIYRYWVKVDENGEETKVCDLDPSLIDLHLVNGGEWLLDESASTKERLVLYYQDILPVGQKTPLFSDLLTVNGETLAKVTQTKDVENGYTTITTEYDYDGVEFRLEVEVNAVQTHNGEDAIWSAWGRRVSVDSNGRLSLN